MNETAEIYESERLVLRQLPGEAAILELATSAQWTLLQDNAGTPSSDHSHEQLWGVRNGLHVHALCDVISGYCALTVLAEAREEGREFENLLREHLTPFSREELLEPVDGIHDPGDRVQRLMRLSLGAPATFHQSFYDRLIKFTEDEDPRVRDAFVLAVNYVAWPRLRQPLKELAEQDSNATVRQDAAATLLLFDESGVSDS